ncbi:hypothetical protein C8A01DRAFT_21510, partial [Parachaetomium inaequale]
KPYNTRQSLNILVDNVADGAGEAVRRYPRSFDHFFHGFCIIIGLNELTKILVLKTF